MARVIVWLVSLLLTTLSAAQAQSVTTIVVPFPPGGGLDGLGRVLAQRLQQDGGSYVVENKAGANGLIGAKAVARSKPDGSTWLMGDGALFAVNPFLYPKDPDYDPERDLQVVRAAGFQPSVLVVNPATNIKSLKEFVDVAKREKMAYASGGIGSAGHLTMEYFKRVAGLKLDHIPYKGGGPAMADLLGGQVQAGFVVLPAALPHVNAGKLVALAVSSKQRADQLPNVPTVDESGYPGFDVETGYFVMLPGQVPSNIAATVDRKVAEALADPAVRERIRANGINPATMDHAESVNWIARNKTQWKTRISEIGIRPE